MSKQPNSTPGKKPVASSLKLRLGRTPLEQRSGSEPLAPSAQRPPTVRKETDEVETGRRSKPVPGVAAEARMSDDVAGGSLSRLDFILWQRPHLTGIVGVLAAVGLLNWSCRTRGTTNSFGWSNFDPSTASDSRPIFLFLFPTWPLHDSIAVMSIGRHRRSWTTLMRASCRTRGMTNSFGPSNFVYRIASGSQPIFPFRRPTWPLPDSIASMSISRHRRPWKMLTTGASLSARALLPT